MIPLVHISDLHFGTVDPHLVEPLLQSIAELDPRLLIVSGDLTQRAKVSQFAAAAAFLKRIEVPQIVVPGNHDIPLWNVFRRFINPLTNYRRHLGREVEPLYEDEELAVVGVNTARSFARDGGRISFAQIDKLESVLQKIPAGTYKIVVMHHPIVPIAGYRAVPGVGRAKVAREMLQGVGTDIILSGHAHHGYACVLCGEPDPGGNSILVLQAGTALSHRRRGVPNSFNSLELEPDTVTVTTHEWVEATRGFDPATKLLFNERNAWKRSTGEPGTTSSKAGQCC